MGRQRSSKHEAEGNDRLAAIDAGAQAEHDPWANPYLPSVPKTGPEDLEAGLKRILRKGLPLNGKRAGDILPNLRSVIARSVHPYDPSSRVESLNQLLVRFLAETEGGAGEALRRLFAVAKGTRDTTLTRRRELAAEAMGYEIDHFRKRIEGGLIEELAADLYADLLRYKRRIRRAPTAEEPTGDTPSLSEKDLTHQEELVSRIWQRVYGLRAELIAQARLEASPGYQSQAEDHRQAAGRELAALREVIAEFRDTYGEELVRHGEAEYASAGLERLVENF